MKITKSYLKQIIKEEYSRIQEETQAIEETEQLEEVAGIAGALGALGALGFIVSQVANMIVQDYHVPKQKAEDMARQATMEIYPGIDKAQVAKQKSGRPMPTSSAVIIDGQKVFIDKDRIEKTAMSMLPNVQNPSEYYSTVDAPRPRPSVPGSILRGAARGTRK